MTFTLYHVQFSHFKIVALLCPVDNYTLARAAAAAAATAATFYYAITTHASLSCSRDNRRELVLPSLNNIRKLATAL